MFTEYFYKDRVDIRKLNSENRDRLFVEVHQKELNEGIFTPVNNLYRDESHFFPKRFAILGDFKAGKTELGKYILYKLNNHYNNCIDITINSKLVEYSNIEGIDNWIYDRWFRKLKQVNNPDFNWIVKQKITEFHDINKYEPKHFEDKIYIICETYREYLRKNKDAKFVVWFDQANIITKEEKFTPFYEFWRNFQGYWEDDGYFSELPIFIFVIGHKNWMDFASLKDQIGRGVFDNIVMFQYWNNSDIKELYEKRLRYAIKPEHQDEYMDYFLCNGIVEYFGKKLDAASTQEYLDQFFKTNLQEFCTDFEKNRANNDNFLEFCQKRTTAKKSDDTYFFEVERIFVTSPANDYTPVFKFLSDNQDERWFDEIFSLMEQIRDDGGIKFDSRKFKTLKYLKYDFIDVNFTDDFGGTSKPVHNPAIFTKSPKTLALNSAFRSCLDAIADCDTRGPIYALKKFVKSTRIGHENFVESKDGKVMKMNLDLIVENSNEILEIVQKWDNTKLVENEITGFFYRIRNRGYELKNEYKKNSTNWPQFDYIGRNLIRIFVDDVWPVLKSINGTILDFGIFKEIENNVFSPECSNLGIASYISQYLSEVFVAFKKIDEIPQENKDTNGEKKTRILVAIDGPNSTGVNLKEIVKYAHGMDENAKCYYLTTIEGARKINVDQISRLGFSVSLNHKDVDHEVKDIISDRLDSNDSPNLILLGTRDDDYTEFIKDIRNQHDVKFQLVIESMTGVAQSLKVAFKESDIKFFPKKKRRDFTPNKFTTIKKPMISHNIYEFVGLVNGRVKAYSKSKKICFVDENSELQPKPGEKWKCKLLKTGMYRDILTPIEKVDENNN